MVRDANCLWFFASTKFAVRITPFVHMLNAAGNRQSDIQVTISIIKTLDFLGVVGRNYPERLLEAFQLRQFAGETLDNALSKRLARSIVADVLEGEHCNVLLLGEPFERVGEFAAPDQGTIPKRQNQNHCKNKPMALDGLGKRRQSSSPNGVLSGQTAPDFLNTMKPGIRVGRQAPLDGGSPS